MKTLLDEFDQLIQDIPGDTSISESPEEASYVSMEYLKFAHQVRQFREKLKMVEENIPTSMQEYILGPE